MTRPQVVRWKMGAGGFTGEVAVFSPDDHDERFRRKGVELLELSDLFVHPLRRNRGWGAALLEAATRWADTNRVDLVLWVIPYSRSRFASTSPTQRKSRRRLEATYRAVGFRSARIHDSRCMLRRCATAR